MFERFERLKRREKNTQVEPIVRPNGNRCPKYRKEYTRAEQEQLDAIQVKGFELLEELRATEEDAWTDDTFRAVGEYIEWAHSYPVIPAMMHRNSAFGSFRHYLRGSALEIDMLAEKQVLQKLNLT